MRSPLGDAILRSMSDVPSVDGSGAETETSVIAPRVVEQHQRNATIARIDRVPLRDVWKHEAHNLTTWLEENVDVLNDVCGLALVGADREQAAGSFSVDLVAEDESGRTVIVENQLERSNHDHLGKLIHLHRDDGCSGRNLGRF
jgi:hypothetical protein